MKKGKKSAYYCQGVGACELASHYRQNEKNDLMLKWAKISEKAWLNYFKIKPDWFNSYYFYARSLGFQGRLKAAIRKGAKEGNRPTDSEEFKMLRDEFNLD